MKSLSLFYATLGILVLGSNAAPYVDHLVDPDPTTHAENRPEMTENGPEMTESGPEIRELQGNLIHDLFNFMDILMDPQSYTNHHEVRFLQIFKVK